MNSNPNVTWWDVLIVAKCSARSQLWANVSLIFCSYQKWRMALVLPRWANLCRNRLLCLVCSWTRQYLLAVAYFSQYLSVLECCWWLFWVFSVRSSRLLLVIYHHQCRTRPSPLWNFSIMRQVPGVWPKPYELCRRSTPWDGVAILQLCRWNTLSSGCTLRQDGPFKP